MDRTTKAVVEEKIPLWSQIQVIVAFGSNTGRFLFATAPGREFLRRDTEKMSVKYDSPASAQRIPLFIAEYGIDVSEVAEPVESFKSLNQFFYRTLVPGSRPVAAAPVVQPADCRLSVFSSVDDATRLWIKGTSFSLAALLGDAELAARFAGGAVAVSRLAPQDYHRFHVPVDCTWSRSEYRELGSEYLTVKPVAVKSPSDVLTRNKRAVAVLHSTTVGDVAFVIVGAIHVASITITAAEGELRRGDEFGYFAFGGSTVVTVFQPGRVAFDDDLLELSNNGMEALVRVGQSLAAQA